MITFANPPEKCAICKKGIKDVLYDIKTTIGPRACTCEACYYEYGIALGTGYGQKYVKNDSGKYIKVGG